jgi:hypothetical protein
MFLYEDEEEESVGDEDDDKNKWNGGWRIGKIN